MLQRPKNWPACCCLLAPEIPLGDHIFVKTCGLLRSLWVWSYLVWSNFHPHSSYRQDTRQRASTHAVGGGGPVPATPWGERGAAAAGPVARPAHATPAVQLPSPHPSARRARRDPAPYARLTSGYPSNYCGRRPRQGCGILRQGTQKGRSPPTSLRPAFK